MEEFINSLLTLNPLWIYIIAAAIAYIENLFPPFPSDVVIVVAGYLCASSRVDFWIVLLVATAGGTLGFITMYQIGNWFGLKVLEAGKFKFIQLDKIHKVEKWFQLYGYLVVIINRFLAGTRAVVAFCAGVSDLSILKTTILASISSLLWNTLLILAGRQLGANWHRISSFLQAYGQIVTIVLIVIVIIIMSRSYFKKHYRKDNA